MSEEGTWKILCTWKIKNYSRTSYFRSTKKINTPQSLLAKLGHNKLFLNVVLFTEIEGLRCLFRYRIRPKECDEIPLKFRFMLLDPNNKVFKSSETLSGRILDNYESSKCTFDNMENRELLRKMSFWSEDTLTLQCQIKSEFDLVLLDSKENPVTSLEFETKIFNDSVFMWSFKIPELRGWAANREANMEDLSIEVKFTYDDADEEISIRMIPHFDNDGVSYFSCDITLTDETDSEIITHTCEIVVRENESCKFEHTFSRQDLEKAKYFLTREIRFKLVFHSMYLTRLVSDSKKTSEQTDMSSKEDNDLLYLRHDLRNLLVDKKFADIKLRSDNELFSAHKVLLAARSPVFSAMFDKDMLESQSGTVDIIDVDSKTLKLFLNYLYTSSIEEMDEESTLALLLAADKYQVVPLVKKCVKFLECALSLTNVCNILLTADMMNNECLKSSSLKYIVENSTKILASPEWRQLLKRNNLLATDVLIDISKKYEDDDSN